MAITGHLVWLAVRALGALRTASPPSSQQHTVKWIFIAFVLGMVILLVDRAVHHDLATLAPLAPTVHAPVAGVLSNKQVWLKFRDWHVAKQHEQATIKHYRVILHDLWDFLAERKTTSPDGLKVPRQWWQVTPKLFERWLERPCKPRTRNAGDPLARTSAYLYSTRALFFYDWASRKRYLPGRNPLDDVAPAKRGARRPRALPMPEVTELLHALEDQQRLYLMCALGYYQALRIGEICRLSIEDIDLGAKPKPLVFVQGKGGRDAWMELNEALVPILRTYLLGRPSSGPLLPNARHPGRHLTPDYASRLVARATRPLVGDSHHAFRHTNASELRAAGVDLLGLMSVLRHASASSTQQYLDNRPGLVAGYLSKLPDPLAKTEPVEPVPT